MATERSKQPAKQEIKLMIVAIFSVFLSVFAHLILAKSFSQLFWTEYTAAIIPFFMLGLCLLCLRYALNADIENDAQE